MTYRNHWKKNLFRYLLFSVFVIFIFTCILNILPLTPDSCNCHEKVSRFKKASENGVKRFKISQYKLAVLVPFRDRFEELLQFAPHMKQFLDKQNIEYHIFILHQVDRFRFNRASLINVGFIHVQNDYDYIAMHDIDLLPLNENLSYGFPNNGPFHVSSPDLHPRYHYLTFIGGILLVNRKHYQAVNGMSNKYWGWGLEDDEFYVRLKEANLKVYRPQNILTGSQNTFKHIHDKNVRKRDTIKCFNQREITRKRDRQTGLSNVSYKIEQVINMTIIDVPLTILNIALNCDKTITPWCECTKTNENKTP
ncbi:beta-1,4-galactosyltransferase 7 [Cotesia glomerata]|uniref:Beta-1,4-N-acetylgalactosaminyltransferase n=1 Tax=Cotesia glomerata TaxID=32391 RepID=A0AAV7HUW5_COTGL|nr:beta-1,4-galactosyltransferase 7 [Cotesia glomerata]XP_044598672.1 beta-1,4-galactosyltransferase 7 [Cotesia glomerata]KAH0537696.1 hypothetical protein KQX54_001067 [Cotesia glomerata]